jgi:hypothetical protein
LACLKDNALSGSQICIVTGPRIDLAIVLIDRMKKLFAGLVIFDTKETVIELKNVKIEEAFPSHHLDAMRGLTNVSFILLDEADNLFNKLSKEMADENITAYTFSISSSPSLAPSNEEQQPWPIKRLPDAEESCQS